MQIQKESVRQNIIDVARSEFLEKGYKNASMRSVALKSNVGLSNIYNYFKNKNEIFRVILTPLLDVINDMMHYENQENDWTIEIFDSNSYMQTQINLFVNLITKFKKELKLLLFNSQGSDFDGFKDKFIDEHTKIGIYFMKVMKDKYPEINSDISYFFLHTTSTWWLAIVGELVSHDMPESEIEVFITEYMLFGTAGWKKIMRIQ